MGVLLMLMTIGGIVMAVILLIISFLTGSGWLRKFTFGCVAIWFGLYLIVLVAVSLMSTEKTLALGEPKEYCGFYLDCHLHSAIADVQTVKSIGDRTAKGEFYIVKVKVSSDARRATLALHSVAANVIDNSGNKYYRDEQAEAQLPPQPEFEKQVAPVESFEKEIVFDLPTDMNNPRLDMREGYGIDHAIEAVLIGDEDSIFHKRNYFKLSEQADTASVK